VRPDDFPRRSTIAQRQLDQLRGLITAVYSSNPFYAPKLDEARSPWKVMSLGDFFRGFPFTTKAELAADQLAHPPFGSNFCEPIENFTRLHQTSGTSGAPLRWLDTPASWQWVVDTWEIIHHASGVTAEDRVFFAFSFGPFLGFWSAFAAAEQMGALCLPAGGMSSVARLRAILDLGATVLCCTPTYALHLGEVAAKENMDLSASKVRILLVAGEPGGSLPATRARLESIWPGARVADHHGMTETGPVTFQCSARPNVLHVVETSFITEVIDPKTCQHRDAGETGELVLTPLGRLGMPLLRYRTGDLVKTARDTVCECGRSEVALEGGILGRVDDMVIVRGVNVYPGAVEQIVREVGGVAEYQVHLSTVESMSELRVEIEPYAWCQDTQVLAHQVENALQAALNLRIPVTATHPGALPRYEMKAQRWVRSRG
jgi:phenylacetate-CoA ligase